jgi:glutaredoxin
MAEASTLPTIEFYTRADCATCDEARLTLQQVLEDRARRGDPAARVRYVNIDGDVDLQAKYAALIPVLVLGGRQLVLNTSYRAIAKFIDAVLGRLA